MSDTNTIWYTQPAAQWCDALPVGNGRLGAMVYGGACAERVYLSDATFLVRRAVSAKQQCRWPGYRRRSAPAVAGRRDRRRQPPFAAA
ncbi:MAG: glycoside hydrolase N-terminal domain-containing protein [Anaerolineales bacterium]|nr:glycoside hydrolase N-terminal domain-containing protein [Anaerolineales bacterium]